MEMWKSWDDDPAIRVFNYEDIAFPFEQYDPQEVVETGLTLPQLKQWDS